MNPGLKALGDLSSLFVRFPNSSHTSPQSTLPGLEQPVLPPKLGRNLTTPWPRGACQGMHQQPRQMSLQEQLQEAEERWIWCA